MVVVDLIPGSHTIEWSLSGYETLVVTINVSDAGAVSCIIGTCSSISIIGPSVTGNLQAIGVTDICTWITALGGSNAIMTYSIMDLVQGYVNTKDLGFVITTAHIMGSVAYYNNQISSGDTLTGCVS